MNTEIYDKYLKRMEQENARYNERWDRYIRAFLGFTIALLYVFAGLAFREFPPFGKVLSAQALYLQIAGTFLLVGGVLVSWSYFKSMTDATKAMHELDNKWKKNPDRDRLPPLMGGSRKLRQFWLFDVVHIPVWVMLTCVSLIVTLWVVF